MKKQTIKLNESQLRKMIQESIMNILNEDYGQNSSAVSLPGKYGQDKQNQLRQQITNILQQNPQTTIMFSSYGGNYTITPSQNGYVVSTTLYNGQTSNIGIANNVDDIINMFLNTGQYLNRNKQQGNVVSESQLRQMIKESLKELDWKTYKNAANKRLAQGKYANTNELSDMAKNRFDDEFNGNYRYDTFGAKLAGKHSKTFDSTFIPTEEPRLQGRNEKGEELFRNNGKYYNSRRGLTTPEKFFKDKQMSDTFNAATQELDNYNNGNYDYAQDKGWYLNESQLRNIIKESIKKVLKENTGSLDDLILYARNDRKIYDALYLVKGALLKKVKSGVTPDRNQLADSSTLRKIQQFAIKNYSKEITPIFLSAEEKRKLREDFADSILEWIDYDMNNHEE